MRNFLVVDGTPLSDFRSFVASSNWLDVPEKKVDVFEIPGRSGGLEIPQNAWKQKKYKVACYSDGGTIKSVSAVMAYLNSRKTKIRIEEAQYPDEFRRGSFYNAFELDQSDHFNASYELDFVCDPQRWLKSGEEKIETAADMQIYNPTYYAALPLLRIYGTGEVGIGNDTLKILKADGYTDIDCDSQEAYKDDASVNCNPNVETTGDSFPVLNPGLTGIKLGSGITKVEIIPRWWTI